MRARLVIGFLHLMAWLPIRAAQACGASIGRIAWWVPNAARAVGARNLERCFPELSTRERKQLLHQTLLESGRALAELGPLWLWPTDKVLGLISETVGREHLDAAARRGKGVIFVGPHLGAWELAGCFCSSFSPGTPILYRPPRLKGLDPIVRRGRERNDARAVPVGRRAVGELLKTLAEGGAVGLLPDQEPKSGTGVFAPFFGIPAYTMVLLSRLIEKTDAAPIFIFAERLPKGRFRLHLVPESMPINTGSLETSVAAVNRNVEACVRRFPGQYQWLYKRFNTRPEGEPAFY